MAYFADTLPDNGITAKDNLRFQEYMSDTAHQREMEDLRRAGLNPVLSAGGSGASSPAGAQDSSETLAILNSVKELAKTISAKQNSAQEVILNKDVMPKSLAEMFNPDYLMSQKDEDGVPLYYVDSNGRWHFNEYAKITKDDSQKIKDAGTALGILAPAGLVGKAAILGIARLLGSKSGRMAIKNLTSKARVASAKAQFGEWYNDAMLERLWEA